MRGGADRCDASSNQRHQGHQEPDHPLLLTDDEAVAMAIGLRLAATQRLVGGAETTLTALAKLEQVLPRPLRTRVNALAATVRPTGVGSGSGASPGIRPVGTRRRGRGPGPDALAAGWR